ncbi:MAG: hypothetical protein ACE1Z9_05250, partial [Acidimicrobiia bacterium]
MKRNPGDRGAKGDKDDPGDGGAVPAATDATGGSGDHDNTQPNGRPAIGVELLQETVQCHLDLHRYLAPGSLLSSVWGPIETRLPTEPM